MSLAHGGGAIFTSGRLLCTHAYVVTTRVDPRESHSLSWLLAQDVQDVDKLKEFQKYGPVEHFFFPHFLAGSALIWPKSEEKSVELVRGSFVPE